MNRENVFLGGGVAAAFISSLCCVLPLIAVAFGLSAFGSASVFDALRPYLLIAAFAALGFSFYHVYFRRPECAEGESCATKPVNKMNQFFLWTAFAVIIAFTLAPYYTGYLAAAATDNRIPAPINNTVPPAADREVSIAEEMNSPANKTAIIAVRGMTCASCETHVEVALRKVPGVVSADADYKKKNVTVTYSPGQVTIKQIREAIAATGYELI